MDPPQRPQMGAAGASLHEGWFSDDDAAEKGVRPTSLESVNLRGSKDHGSSAISDDEDSSSSPATPSRRIADRRKTSGRRNGPSISVDFGTTELDAHADLGLPIPKTPYPVHDLAADAFEQEFRREQMEAAVASGVAAQPGGPTEHVPGAGSLGFPVLAKIVNQTLRGASQARENLRGAGVHAGAATVPSLPAVSRERTGNTRVQLLHNECLSYAPNAEMLLPAIRELVARREAFNESSTADEIRRAIWWLDIDSPTLADMDALSTVLGIHPLTVEDCLSGDNSREKWEVFETADLSYLFCTMHEVCLQESEETALHIILQPTCILTVHVKPVESVFSVLERVISLHDSRIPATDWMLYAFLDSIVDVYEEHTQSVVDEIYVIDDMVLMLSPSEEGDVLFRIKLVRTRQSLLLRQLQPKRALLVAFSQQPLQFVSESVKLYFRDVFDHLTRQLNALDAARDVMSSAHANYLGSINLALAKSSTSVGESMAKLSIVGTIFMPLTFITGAMGMNVRVPGQSNFPTGDSVWWFWSIMLFNFTIAISLWWYLRKRVHTK